MQSVPDQKDYAFQFPELKARFYSNFCTVSSVLLYALVYVGN